MYQNYGDKRVFEQHYNGLKAWADFLHRHAPDGVVDYSYFGDWVAIDPTPKILAATWAYIKSLDVVAMAANVLGKEDDAAQYRALATAARDGFNKHFRQSGWRLRHRFAGSAGAGSRRTRDARPRRRRRDEPSAGRS